MDIRQPDAEDRVTVGTPDGARSATTSSSGESVWHLTSSETVIDSVEFPVSPNAVSSTFSTQAVPPGCRNTYAIRSLRTRFSFPLAVVKRAL